MKTEKQKERDKKGGIINFDHEFDQKTGKVLGKGLIRQEIDPEAMIASLEPMKAKINEYQEHIDMLNKQLESAPVNCEVEIKNFLGIQKKSALWLKAEASRDQLKSRIEEMNLLVDDLSEHQKLIAEYKKWKETK